MLLENAIVLGTIGPEVTPHEEVPMVRRERWEEIRRLWVSERVPTQRSFFVPTAARRVYIRIV